METSKENVTDVSREPVSTTLYDQKNTKTALYLKNRGRQRNDNLLYVIWLADEKKWRSIEQALVRTDLQMQICKSCDECYDCITEWHTGRVCLILDGSSCETQITTLHSFTQLESIYVVCQDDVEVMQLKHLSEIHDKVKCVLTDIVHLCARLKQTENFVHEFATFSPELDSGNNSQEISFMFARLLRDVFLSLEPNDEEKREFENWCRDEYLNDETTSAQLNEFTNFYTADDAAVWYTRPIFLFGLLNRSFT